MKLNFSLDTLSPIIYRDLSVFRPTLDLFPNLQKLVCSHGSDQDTVFAHLFVGPHLEEVSIESIQDGADILLRSLMVRSPLLKKLSIRNIGSSFMLGTILTLEQIVPSMSNLTAFTCDIPLTLAMVQRLSTLPALSSVTLSLVEDPSLDTGATTSIIFSYLNALDITMNRITSTLVKLMDALVMPQVCAITISLLHQPTSDALEWFFRAVEDFPLLDTLHIRLLARPTKFFSEYLATRRTLKPLFGLPLTTLNMAQIPFRLNDEDLLAIGEAVPTLKTLKLGNLIDQLTSTITFNGLCELSRRCSSIKCIGLHVNFHTLSMQALTGPKPQAFISVCELELGASLTHDAHLMAAMLSAVFPNAEITNEVFGSVSQNVRQSWSVIRNLTRIISLARRQEEQAALQTDRSLGAS